jgi:asparagine synthase (glutamine-hydrolysing)
VCGFAGAVAAVGARTPLGERVDQAVRALHHRGPDGSGVYAADCTVVLGHTRLAIVDIERGSQPMTNEDGSVVTVFNGEIWNHDRLRQTLMRAGHRFRSRSDTEVLVHGYEEWGVELLQQLDGMFAFALWDARRERLLLARDRIGKKPLYYTTTSAGIAFGSDARAVLMIAGAEPQLDPERVPEFLFRRYVSSPQTLYAGVSKLAPGELLVYDRQQQDVRSYWRLEVLPEQPVSPRELRTLLRDAVARRLMGDVPVGVLLSGGVDSAAVLGLMREAGALTIPSFTIGFADRRYDERPWAQLAATRYGSEHHELVVDARSFLDALPRLAWYRDEPIAEASEVPLLLLAELVSRHVKVVLSGDGGDELFGGYPKYRAERLLRQPLVPRGALGVTMAALARRPTHRNLSRAAETLAIRDVYARWASWFRSFSVAELRDVLGPRVRPYAGDTELLAPVRNLLASYREVDADRQILISDFLSYLPDNMLARADKVLMAASVEGRFPLLDAEVVTRAMNTPAAARFGLRNGKLLLRRAVADLVPCETLRQPKRGFPVPVAQLLVDDRRRVLERMLLSERCLDRGVLAPDAVRRLVLDEPRLANDRALKVFTLASLELWCRTNIDELRPAPPNSFAELLEEREVVSAR